MDRSYRPVDPIPVSILRKSISGRHRAVRVADGPMTARCRFTQNASWDNGPEHMNVNVRDNL